MNLTMSEQQSLQKTVSNSITALEVALMHDKLYAHQLYHASDKLDPATLANFKTLNVVRTNIRNNKSLIAKLAKLSKILKGQ